MLLNFYDSLSGGASVKILEEEGTKHFTGGNTIKKPPVLSNHFVQVMLFILGITSIFEGQTRRGKKNFRGKSRQKSSFKLLIYATGLAERYVAKLCKYYDTFC